MKLIDIRDVIVSFRISIGGDMNIVESLKQLYVYTVKKDKGGFDKLM